nr:MAG TPA: hypothetical protein [Caudoviricetes sp.]
MGGGSVKVYRIPVYSTVVDSKKHFFRFLSFYPVVIIHVNFLNEILIKLLTKNRLWIKIFTKFNIKKEKNIATPNKIHRSA